MASQGGLLRKARMLMIHLRRSSDPLHSDLQVGAPAFGRSQLSCRDRQMRLVQRAVHNLLLSASCRNVVDAGAASISEDPALDTEIGRPAWIVEDQLLATPQPHYLNLIRPIALSS